jgi:hypothetical protein
MKRNKIWHEQNIISILQCNQHITRSHDKQHDDNNLPAAQANPELQNH